MPSADTAPQPKLAVGPKGLRLGTDPPVPLLCGAMHYFRVPRRHWDACLDAIVELRLPLVETYVPWSVHECGEGRFDFGDGPVVGGFERDLGGFLDACAQRGLWVILRPGPHINAELTFFGYPERILTDRRCLALGSRGNPVVLPTPPRAFPVPSYASQAFLHEAGVWLKAFGDFVARYLWPAGPVVAAQVDNEHALFFRTGAYDQDYHPDALALYAKFLERRYPERGTDPDPPRRFDPQDREGLVRHLDWVAFKEWMVVRALDHLGRVLKMCGFDKLPLTHNFPAQGWGMPCSIAAAEEALDLVGLDVYSGKRDYAAVKRHALSLAGASRVPFVPELGCGGWPWWFAFSAEDQQAAALNLLMHGVKGLNLYMLVERDRWYGSPLGPDARRRPKKYAAVRALIDAIRGTDPDPGLPELERQVSVGLMRVRDYERLAVCSALTDPFPPVVLDLFGVGIEEVAPPEPTPGFNRPIALDYARVLTGAVQALERLQLPFHYVDSELSAERLAAYKLLIVPAFAFMDRALTERLERFVAGGGELLLVPEAPSLDGRMVPLDRYLPEHDACELDRLEQHVAALGLAPPVRAAVDVSVFHDDQGAPRVLFVANPGDRARQAQVTGLPPCAAHDALGGQPVDLGQMELGPHEIRMIRLGDRPRGSGVA